MNPVGYEGEPLTLTNGREVRIKYGMRGLLRLEEEFGGLGNIGEVVRGQGGRVLASTMTLLACGLLGEHDGSGAPLTADRLADLLDPTRFHDYGNAAGRALSAAFPQAPQDGAAQQADPQTDSRGPSGTTSLSSSSVAATPSSGA